jgi:hypothetical protein
MKFKIILCSFILPILFLTICIGSAALAVTGNGAKVSGTVIDGKNGEKLIGVTVSIEGTKKGAKTNLDGHFSIQIEAGVYSIKISYIGYQTKIIPNTELRPDETTKLDITLEAAAVSGKEVVVTSKVETETETAQLLARKNAATMNDVLAADQIRRSPDATSADAIKRVSGITVVDNKFVQIRGTSERYNNALLNGAALSSSEPDKKAFSFDMLPSNLIDNTIVSKTFTPDLPANFAGGLVQINTVNFPDKFNARMTVGGGYNTVTTGSNFMSYQTGGTDWLGYDDGTRALPSGFPEKNIRGDQSITPEQLTEYSKMFPNNWAPRTIQPAINSSFALSVGNSYPVADESEFGFIGSLTYKNSFEHSEISRNTYNPDHTALYERSGVKDIHDVSLGAMLNLTYRFSPSHSISFKNLFDQFGNDQVVELAGSDYSAFFADKQTGFQYVQRTLYSGQLTGEHNFEDFGKSRVDWHLSGSSTKRSEPDLRRYVYGRPLDDSTQPEMMLISTTSNPANGGRFYSDMSEKTGELGLNYSIPVGATKIKAGGLYNSRTRDFSARVLAFKLANAANYTLVYQPIDSIFREENMGPQGFQIDEITNENDRYDASEHVSAGYAMADIPFGLAGAQMRFIGGARVERSSQSVNSTYLGGGPVHYNRVHTDVLPSINLVYSVTESLNIRAAASQTVTRPEFREIAPFSFYDFELNSLIQGDTNIDRALITNLDFRAEFFPTAGELVSLSLFHKRFEGAIEATNEGSNNVRSWANSKNPAINYGFEIEIRKNLDFITRALADFVFTANYSYIVSRVDVKELTQGQQDYRPMQGQSPYTINLGLLFTEPELGTSASVLYNTFGKRIAEVNFYTGDLYEFPRNVVDFTLSQKLWSNIELKYSAKDILAETQYFANEDFDKSKINPSLAPEKNPQGIYDRSNKRSAVHVISITYKF